MHRLLRRAQAAPVDQSHDITKDTVAIASARRDRLASDAAYAVGAATSFDPT
jgi:hypothetical protein